MWDDFVAAFQQGLASANEKKWLKDELEACTQHPEKNLKKFIYVISEFYDRIGVEVADDVKVNRMLCQMHPPAARLRSGNYLLKFEGPGRCSRWPNGASAVPATILSTTQNKPSCARRHIWPHSMPDATAVHQHSTSVIFTPNASRTPGHTWPLHFKAAQPLYHRDQWPIIQAQPVVVPKYRPPVERRL
ncbi:hypothetical protein MRX96_026057 [Rhipicephalus microplus]